MCGFSYNGVDKTTGKPRFNRVYMIDIYCTEAGVFLRSIIEEWNRPVHIWLKYCIHTRVGGGSKLKIFATFCMSAVWHGFYPLYFGSFLFYSVGTVNFNFIYKMFVLHKALRRPIIYVLQS